MALWLGLKRRTRGQSVEADPGVRRSNMRLLLTGFGLVGKGRPPCSERSRSTSIAAQQNR